MLCGMLQLPVGRVLITQHKEETVSVAADLPVDVRLQKDFQAVAAPLEVFFDPDLSRRFEHAP